MGLASTYEDILRRIEESEFADHEIAADLRMILAAEAEPRVFSRRSKPPPKLKASKKLTKQQQRYRNLQIAKQSASHPRETQISEEVAITLWHLQHLRFLVEKQASSIGPTAPYNSLPHKGDDDKKSVGDMAKEIEQLKVILKNQLGLLRHNRLPKNRT